MVSANLLRDHPSPYLALHGNDPVDWRPWDESALEIARQSDRLLLVSVGYFACHWCHVMQRESYQNPDIASYLNTRFVPVKVDRELEPALDARLIEFAETTTGRAGWPLNVFVTPDGYPLFAVLYMPPKEFRQVLERLDDVWHTQRARMESLARRIAKSDIPAAIPVIDPGQIAQLRSGFIEQALAFHDDFEGGFGNQNKFPQVPALQYLVELATIGDGNGAKLRSLLALTLDAMAGEGMYDHIGGGFFRYVVDPGWTTPHFEKMLYDNAQLALLYLRASRLFPESHYLDIAQETLAFMWRDMRSPEGALVASFSAIDNHNVEGGYYLFSDRDLEGILDPDELRVLKTRCDIRGAAIFDAGHHLRCSRRVDHVAKTMGISDQIALDLYASARKKLFEKRRQRTLPVDDKLLAGWNGLALSAFSAAAGDLGGIVYAEAARDIRNYIVNTLWRDGRLARARVGAEELGSASLEDYAMAAQGLWDFAEKRDSVVDRTLVRHMVEAAFQRFRVNNGWRLEERTLLAEAAPMALITDSPLPAPSAVLASLSIEVGNYFKDASLLAFAQDALNRAYDTLSENAFFYATHIRGLNLLTQQPEH